MKSSRNTFETRLTPTFKQPSRPGTPQVVSQRLFDVSGQLLGTTTGIGMLLKDLFKVVRRGNSKRSGNFQKSSRTLVAFGHSARRRPLRRLTHLSTTTQRRTQGGIDQLPREIEVSGQALAPRAVDAQSKLKNETRIVNSGCHGLIMYLNLKDCLRKCLAPLLSES